MFSPRSLYHPREIEELHDQNLLPKHNPIIPCIIALTALAFYMLYQALVVYQVTDHSGGNATPDTNTTRTVAPLR